MYKKNGKNEYYLIAEIAHMFYIEDIPQIEIAKKFLFSRAKVSRILKKAKEKKIVDIQIHYPLKQSIKLENELKMKFNLENAIVIDEEYEKPEYIIKRIGEIAAEYIDDILKDGDSIGLSWGNTLFQMVKHMYPKVKKDIHVVQITGGASDSYKPETDSASLVRKMADLYGGKFSLLYAPLYVESKIVKHELMKEPLIKKTLNEIKNLDYIVTGIAGMNNINEKIVTWAGFMSEKKKQSLVEKGAVGYICGHFFDINGNALNDNIEKNIIGIEWEELINVKNLIAIAGGINKAKSIYGALKGKLIKCLITDSRIAKKLLIYES